MFPNAFLSKIQRFRPILTGTVRPKTVGSNTGVSSVHEFNKPRWCSSSWPRYNILQKQQQNNVLVQQTRNKHYVFPKLTKINYSRETGKGVSFQPVIERFFRLNNGLWIRPSAKKGKGKYKMSKKQRVRSLQHVVCNRQQCEMLDKFVEEKYKRPHYFPDDPYAPYHKKYNVLGYKYVPKKFYP